MSSAYRAFRDEVHILDTVDKALLDLGHEGTAPQDRERLTSTPTVWESICPRIKHVVEKANQDQLPQLNELTAMVGLGSEVDAVIRGIEIDTADLTSVRDTLDQMRTHLTEKNDAHSVILAAKVEKREPGHFDS